MSELKPCPFCGGEAAVFTYNNEEYDVKCRNPYCLAKSSRWDTEAEAVEAWNTRADDYKQAAEYWRRMYEESFAERTCENLSEDFAVFHCSVCDYFERDCACANYCPNCGAKVVG